MLNPNAAVCHAESVQAPGPRTTRSLTPTVSRHYQDLKQELHTKLVDVLKPEEVNRIPEKRRRLELRGVVESLIDADGAFLS